MQMNTTIILLIAVVISQILVLVLLLQKKRLHPMSTVTGSEQSQALKKILGIQSKLTSIQWNVGIVLNGDTGKPNITQQQFLHQAIEDCSQAVIDLNAALKDLRCLPTSSKLSKEN